MVDIAATAIAETLRDALAVTEPEQSGVMVKEAFDRVMGMLQREDQGWKVLTGSDGEDKDGLDLDDLKEWSHKIREAVIGAPWMKRGLGLRHSYIWRDGIQYKGIEGPKQGKKNVRDLIDDTLNQHHFFSTGAQRRREGSLYHDGVAFWIGNQSTKNLQSIPLAQITDLIEDPDGLGLVWAYRREWSRYNLQTGKTENMVRWYFTDRFVGKRVAKIKTATGPAVGETVDQGHIIFDMHANGMDGTALGAPDALAAYVWNGIARDAYMDGRVMTQAMATYAYKATTNSKSAGDNASIAFATEDRAGSTAVLGGANNLTAMNTAGRGYDFSSLNSLTAVIATALDVSNIALTADTSAAGSSYGSAQTLDLPTRLAMEARRQEHVEMDERVLAWMGAKDAEAYFKSYTEDSEIYRSIQGVVLKWNTGLYTKEEIKADLEAIVGAPADGRIPQGVMMPNNSKFTDTLTNDGQPSGGSDADDKGGKPNSTAAPDQGASNGTGGQDSSGGDIRK